MPKICKNCGAKLPDVAKFCTKCGGSDLAVQQAAPQQGAQPQYQQPPVQQPYAQQPYGRQPYGYPQQPPKKSKKRLVIAIIIIVLILGLTAIAAFVRPGFLKANNPLLGKWESSSGEKWTFQEGDKVVIDNGSTRTYTYKLDGDKVSITGYGKMMNYYYTIEGNTLCFWNINVNGGKGQTLQVKFVSVINSGDDRSSSKGDYNSGGGNSGSHGYDPGQDSDDGPTYDEPTDNEEGLVGKWILDDDEHDKAAFYIFLKNGKGWQNYGTSIDAGDGFVYTANEGLLYAKFHWSEWDAKFKITGDHLIFDNGKSYYRESSDVLVDPALIGDWYDQNGVLTYTFYDDCTVFDGIRQQEACYFTDSKGHINIWNAYYDGNQYEGWSEGDTYKVYNNVLTITREYDRSVESYYR